MSGSAVRRQTPVQVDAVGRFERWRRQFSELAADHRVVRYDWRGYGQSGNAAGEFSHHRHLLALLDALDIERAALVGCSMGGAYALDVTLAAPERVSALTLICSGACVPDDPAAPGPVAGYRQSASIRSLKSGNSARAAATPSAADFRADGA